ncbi:MAG: HAMP domain-containing protein [Thermoplasmata archaeon]|nr:HAMP domain-containing protein [Thermoplasmata archaeon]
MKIGMKLMMSFTVVAVLLVANLVVGSIMDAEVDEAWTGMEGANQDINDINALALGINEEFAHGMRYFTIDRTKADQLAETLEHKEELCEANDLMFASIQADFESKADECEVHEHLAEDLEILSVVMETMDEAFEENATFYPTDTGRVNVELFTTFYAEQMEIILGHEHEEEAADHDDHEEEEDDHMGIKHMIGVLYDESEEAEEKVENAEVLEQLSAQLFSVTAIVLLFLVGFLITNSITSRLKETTDAAQKVREGKFDFAVSEAGNDEVTDLSKAFNQMVLSIRLMAGDLDEEMAGEEVNGSQDTE